MRKTTNLLMLFLVSFLLFSSNQARETTGRFLIVSDLHLDLSYEPDAPVFNFCRNASAALLAPTCVTPPPLYNNGVLQEYQLNQPQFGQRGCDTPFDLMMSSFRAMKRTEPDPDFILMLGDVAAHCVPDKESLMGTIRNATEALRLVFPDVPILPTLGNNDVLPHNQIPTGPNALLDSFSSDVWADILDDGQKETFSMGGYYNKEVVEGLHIISLNTLFYRLEWCPLNDTICSGWVADVPDPDPSGQFAWLTAQLDSIRSLNHSAYIIAHVGPNRSRSATDQWQAIYVSSFLSILSNFSDVVRHSFFGHNHRDFFTVYRTADQAVAAMFSSGALTVRDKSNPNFKVASYDPDTQHLLSDLETYYFDFDAFQNQDTTPPDDVPFWHFGYSFFASYLGSGTPHITADQITKLLDTFRSDVSLVALESFGTRYASSYAFASVDLPARYYLCEIDAFSPCVTSRVVLSSPALSDPC